MHPECAGSYGYDTLPHRRLRKQELIWHSCEAKANIEFNKPLRINGRGGRILTGGQAVAAADP
jgi:hypothetical protein